MREPNKHDWTDLFIGDVCRLCYGDIETGTGKAEHARKHVREGRAERVGEGTKSNPYRFVPTENANGANAKADEQTPAP